jgi:hypothetical protein
MGFALATLLPEEKYNYLLTQLSEVTKKERNAIAQQLELLKTERYT